MELNFIEEDMPKVTREGGQGRAPVKWEDELAPLKDHAGKSFRVWTYEKRTAATSRVQGVRTRLVTATPADNWTVAVRPIQVDGAEQFGVYVVFNGVYTDDEVAANAAKRDARSAKIKAQREAAAQSANVVDEATPAQKVAATRKTIRAA
jgi:hypothetical protein